MMLDRFCLILLFMLGLSALATTGMAVTTTSNATTTPTTRPSSCPSMQPKCPLTCYFHGQCDEATGSCACSEGWTGEDCGARTCSDMVCSINGDCCGGGCCCHAGWTGVRCDVFVGKSPYAGPACTVDGRCSCGANGQARARKVGVDLVPLFGTIFASWEEIGDCHCALETGCLAATGLRKILRFDTYSLNRGNADLFIGFPGSHPER